jgi:8-oxo-dGTP pyrophosphatase MutT (NUDIX family)
MSRTQHLASLLETFAPADARELEHKRRLLQLLRETPEPFSRAQFTPGHVTASAFILDRAHAALLLILHAKLQLWLQPGGHVDATDPDVLSSALREVREETGLDDLVLARPGVLDVDVHQIPARGTQPAHEHFDVRFLFTSLGAQPVAASDARDVRWVPLADLLGRSNERAPGFPSDESVLRAVRKLRAWSA